MKRTVAVLVLSAAVFLVVAVPTSAQAPVEVPVVGEETPTAATPPAGTEKPKLYNGTDPDRNLLPSMPKPFSIGRYPQQLDPALRAVVLTPHAARLVQGGQLVREVAFDATSPVGLEQVALVVDDSSWIATVAPGVFELPAALVQDPGTELRFAVPAVREVRLITNPGVFIGGSGARARFEGVRVRSWDRVTGSPSTDVENARPFILYERGSRLDIVDSDMGFLGSDRTSAYGVSWRLEGTTGEVLRSRFHHSFFGVYTYEAKDIVFRHNVFSDNAHYGFDPHDYSTGLVVEENEAYGNGSHGFIVSRYVTGTVIARNHSHDNGGNGIVLDYQSDRNRIVGNRVESNAKDGIVLNGSSGNVVEDNDISANRVGIRASHPNSGNLIERNRLDGNVIGISLDTGTAAATLSENDVLGSTRVGLILSAPGSSVKGDRITGALVGIDLRAAVTLSGVRVSGVERGIVVRRGGEGHLRDTDLRATEIGIHLENGGDVALVDSDIQARRPIEGWPSRSVGTTLEATGGQLPWQPIVGAVIILVAAGLELLRTRRDPRVRPQAPAGIWNTA